MKRIIIGLVLLIGLMGCGSEPVKLDSGDICNDEYKGKNVEIVGQLYLPKSIITGGRMHMYIKGSGAIISFSQGKEKNCMEKLPYNYDDSDVKIHDINGEVIKVGDKVRMVGEMVATSKAYCSFHVEEIEKISN